MRFFRYRGFSSDDWLRGIKNNRLLHHHSVSYYSIRADCYSRLDIIYTEGGFEARGINKQVRSRVNSKKRYVDQHIKYVTG